MSAKFVCIDVFGKEFTETWEEGKRLNVSSVNKVERAEFSGGELNAVRTIMTGLPYNKENNKQVWFGDHAKFIMFNL